MWKLACEKGRQVWSFDKSATGDDELRQQLASARSEWESGSHITKHSRARLRVADSAIQERAVVSQRSE